MSGNKLFYGDNLEVLRNRIPSESVDLVYLDPPFNSNRNYNVLFGRHETHSATDSAQIQAFGDTWVWTPETDEQYLEMIHGGVPSRVGDALNAFRTLLGENDAMAYLVNMAPRLVQLHRVLKASGSLYLHCDPTMSHYLKILLDAIFDARNFRSEIVWKRYGAHNDSKGYGAVHDIILFYDKNTALATFNKQYMEYDESYVSQRFRYADPDGRRYREQNLASPNPRPNLTYAFEASNGVTYPPPANGWKFTPERMQQLDAEGRLHFPKRVGGRMAQKNYLDEAKGVPVQDVWNDISPIGGTSPERLGYPTQKPLSLLERIINSSSNEGDVVLDPFCGCGTAVDAAQKLRRNWIGIDVTYIAVDLIHKRLRHVYGAEVEGTYDILGIPRDRAGAFALFSHSPFDFERWAVSLINAQPNEKQVGDKGIDGVARFFLDGSGKNLGRILVSVKGGKTIGPQFVRDLLGTVESQKAEMGVLLTMSEPTRGIIDAVNHAGTYIHPANGQKFPKVQVMTVDQLLKGERPNMPLTTLPYIEAKRVKAKNTDEGLF